MKPITPAEAIKKTVIEFPDAVLEAFNEAITSKLYKGTATVKQDDVVALMVKKGLKREDIFSNHWLDVENTFRKAGWNVVYDRPGYNETYPATYTFTSRK